MGAGDLVRVRYRAGVVGETRRVVHVAATQPGGVHRTLCTLVIRDEDAELLGEVTGMPCMACTRTLSRGTATPRAEESPIKPGRVGAKCSG